MMKYAVITGATQGIGRAVAERLLKEGFSVAVCARGVDALREQEQQWRQQYPEALLICQRADMGNPDDVNAFATQILERFPRVDILVNNAGIFLPGALATEPEGNLEMLMSVNVFGAYRLTRQLLPRMKEQGSGHIFNICSVASLRAYPNGGAYSITKYALLGFSENLRLELMPWSIRVTAICPGAVWTASWEGSGAPEGRMMQAADVADVLWTAYALSPNANVDRIVLHPLGGDI
jgi:NAD(P)-dependent dehydrogenase (short-subunit alcohol dehydrogenase family)